MTSQFSLPPPYPLCWYKLFSLFSDQGFTAIQFENTLLVKYSGFPFFCPQSVREGQETRPSPMDEGFHEQSSHEQHPATAPGNTSACPPAATTTAVPQMDSRGFYIPPESTTRSSPAARNTPANRSTAATETTRHASYIPPEPHGPKTIQIFVTNFNGKSERFEIRANASVKDLQKLIHDKVGVPPSQQRLVYQGREFQDGNSLQSYGVKDMSTINLLGRLRGGR